MASRSGLVGAPLRHKGLASLLLRARLSAGLISPRDLQELQRLR